MDQAEARDTRDYFEHRGLLCTNMLSVRETQHIGLHLHRLDGQVSYGNWSSVGRRHDAHKNLSRQRTFTHSELHELP
jgi:hypothetical protein